MQCYTYLSMTESHRNRQASRTTAPSAAPSIRARLEDLKSLLEEAKRLERLLDIAEKNSAEAAGKPVTDRIHDLLRSNPDMWFSPAEIMECIHVRDEHTEAVRKALQRLCGRDLVIRTEHAKYRINLPPSEGPTP